MQRLPGFAIFLTVIATTGCAEPELELSEVESFATVGGSTGGCSTAVVIGLSKQISDEIGCMSPTSLVHFTATSKITITSNAVLPYLAASAKDDMVAAANAGSLQVNSAFRTIAQQYLLVRWHDAGRCGITATAPVGTSNHESGRALDLANYSSRISVMANHGWAHDVPGDDVHFDHLSSPDIRGRDTKAFQRLWNRNHPTDTIAEDGDYGPATESRLAKSPAEGFAIGPICNDRTEQVDVVMVDGPDLAPPATRVHYTLKLKNSGQVDWPATTALVTADGAASDLHDDSWTSPSEVTALAAPVTAGGVTTIDLDVMTPNVTTETPVHQTFALHDGATTFGEIDLMLTVSPGGDVGTSIDGSEEESGGGGCSAGGGVGWAAMFVVIGVVTARRRRALVLALGVTACTSPTQPSAGDDDVTVDAGVDVDAPDGTPDAPAPIIEVLRGVDRASAFTVAQAKTLETTHGVKWSGVYVGGACNAGSGWSRSVVTSLHAATNWKFMPIWVGQQSPAICDSHTLTAAKGTADGLLAAERMAAFGWEGGKDIPIALDIEGGTYSYSPSGATAYVTAWTKALHDAGYRVYVYSSPAGINHFHASTGIDGAWVASWFYSGFHDSQPGDLDQIGNNYTHQNRAWQYAGDFTVPGVGTVDANVSELLLAPAPGGSNN